MWGEIINPNWMRKIRTREGNIDLVKSQSKGWNQPTWAFLGLKNRHPLLSAASCWCRKGRARFCIAKKPGRARQGSQSPRTAPPAPPARHLPSLHRSRSSGCPPALCRQRQNPRAEQGPSESSVGRTSAWYPSPIWVLRAALGNVSDRQSSGRIHDVVSASCVSLHKASLLRPRFPHCGCTGTL